MHSFLNELFGLPRALAARAAAFLSRHSFVRFLAFSRIFTIDDSDDDDSDDDLMTRCLLLVILLFGDSSDDSSDEFVIDD